MATKFKQASAPAKSTQAPNLAGWLFPAYLATIFAGYILLRTPGAMASGQEMGPVRALFSAVNAGTLTGFPQTVGIDSYQPLGQAAIFTLIVSGSLFVLVIGASAVTRILRLGYSDAQILRAALIGQTAAIVAGTIVLLFDKDRTLPQAIFLAASAFGNSGLFLGAAPSATAWQTHLAILPLIAMGGLGLCVLMELFDLFRGRRKALSHHARTALMTTAWLYVGGTLLLALLSLGNGQSLPNSLASSAAAAIGSRTAGLGLVPVEQLTRPAVWIVMLLMAVGACTGGAAGGIKTTTLAELFRGVRRALAGQSSGRAFGVAATWATIYLLLIVITLLLLLFELPQDAAERVLFDAVSAASNVGLTFEPLNPDRPVTFILCGAMLIGRIAPLMILWWMADATEQADLAAGMASAAVG